MGDSKDQVDIFDFDKTITTIDTFTSLITYLINQEFVRQCFAIPFLPIIFSLKPFHITRPYAVSIGLWIASVGKSGRCLVRQIDDYANKRKSLGTHDVMRQRALDMIGRHLSDGHRVIVVSASSRIWIKKLLGKDISEKVTIVGSRIKYKWNGLVLNSWCHGEGKLEHLSRFNIQQDNFRTIYSDCTSDLALMERAKNRCFINIPEGRQKKLEAKGEYYFLKWPL